MDGSKSSLRRKVQLSLRPLALLGNAYALFDAALGEDAAFGDYTCVG